jgi:hypothetical protein
VGTAVERVVGFDAMPNHLDVAVLADRSEGVDRTLEAVEGVRTPIGRTYLKGLIVIISTDFALRHIHLLLPDTGMFHISKVNTLATAGTNAR